MLRSNFQGKVPEGFQDPANDAKPEPLHGRDPQNNRSLTQFLWIHKVLPGPKNVLQMAMCEHRCGTQKMMVLAFWLSYAPTPKMGMLKKEHHPHILG